MVKKFPYHKQGAKAQQYRLTHKNLKDAVSVIMDNEEEMILILRSPNQKPFYFWHRDLNGKEYVKSADKEGYLLQKTGISREQIILPVVKPALMKVANNIGSKAVAKIEKEVYDIVVNANQ